jgi:hypothetical protein
MQIPETLQRSAHIFAGAGGDMCGFSLAGLSPAFAVEINHYRLRYSTLSGDMSKNAVINRKFVLIVVYSS